MLLQRDTTIRPAGPADARQVGDVFLAARAEALPRLRPQLSEAETRDYLARLIDQSKHAVWVAERDGHVVGFLALRESWVDHLYVHPDYYRNGIGTRLLDCAKQARPRGLRLYCFHCDQRAQAFYRARGLVAAGFAGGAGNAEPQPDVEYQWKPAA
ncbi:MAG TPA: GNAT family N-acetyltransferase [Acetobacteraceae bacterium]|nr:GNAT family N-acetyltransferase [Acetobacteraceae bacterium]